MILVALAACGLGGAGTEPAQLAAEPPPPPPEDLYAAADAFNATRPVFERPLADGRAGVAGLPDLSAQTCAACHPEIAAEWALSVHAQAWIDPQFQAEIKKSDNRWLCLNCHTPLQIQQDTLTVDLIDDDVERPVRHPNPDFDPALRDEGITCAGCHVRDGVIHGPGLGGDAPHPVEVDEDLRAEAICLRCHQANATYPGKNFLCVFDTGEEWRAGPYPERDKSCADCHMPQVERPAAVGGPVRTVRRHWWRGSGIPKIEGRYPPPEANPFGLELTAGIDGDALAVTATNANAGHMLPTGDPERKVRISITFHDADDAPLSSEAHVIGQDWTWEPPTKHGDNRLAPEESRQLRFEVPRGAVRATVEAHNQRMSEENRAYHHLDGYPIEVRTHALTVDLAR